MTNGLIKGSMAVAVLFCSQAALAQSVNLAYSQPASIPTMGELGLVGLIAALGIAAGIYMKNRNK